MYEIPTLAIVNEVYFRMAYDYDELFESFKKRLDEKCEKLKDGKLELGNFSEFGLRRRLSAKAQEIAIEKLADLSGKMHGTTKFIGTSNVYLAKKYNLTPVGTMAHEWIMCVGPVSYTHLEKLECSNHAVEKVFYDDLEAMYSMYQGEKNDI